MTKKTQKKSAPGKQTPKKPDTRKWYERVRPFDPQIAQEICLRVADGSNVNRIAPELGLNATDVFAWMRVNHDFAEDYQRAREARADSRSDRIDDYVNDMIGGNIDAQVARVAIEAEKWQAGKERPAYYGDRQQVDHNAGGDLASFLAKIAANPKKVTDK